MSQCVPNWDLPDQPPSSGRPPFPPRSGSTIHDGVPMMEYDITELKWNNGQLAMQGLGRGRPPCKLQFDGGGGGGGGGGDDSKYAWDNKTARATGTLESLVNQGTKGNLDRRIDVGTDGGDLVPWFADNHRSAAAAAAAVVVATPTASAGTTMDALVPSAAAAESNDTPVAARAWDEARDSREVTVDTCEREFAVGGEFTATATTAATSRGSLENASSGRQWMRTFTATTDDHDSVCHSTPQGEEDDEADRKKENAKSSGSTKRSRAAAIHNQSERKRRDKINQRMKTLQKLVPNSNKTDKASMLDEVIEYLKQLQAQVNMMSRMNMSGMMMTMAMQQQLPMGPLMPPMGLGMGMPGVGMGIGMGTMDHLNMIAGRPSLSTGMPPLLHSSAFLPIAPWDGGPCDQLQPASAMMMTDPLSTFLACQSQPMTLEAYNRMTMMFQHLNQPPPSMSDRKN